MKSLQDKELESMVKNKYNCFLSQDVKEAVLDLIKLQNILCFNNNELAPLNDLNYNYFLNKYNINIKEQYKSNYLSEEEIIILIFGDFEE